MQAFDLFPAPLPINWIISIVILLAAARADSTPLNVREVLVSPVGIAGMLCLSFFAFAHEAIIGTSILIYFFALLAEQHRIKKIYEPFANVVDIDAVTSKNKWLVEKVLDERPLAIQDNHVRTYPISDLQ